MHPILLGNHVQWMPQVAIMICQVSWRNNFSIVGISKIALQEGYILFASR